MIVGATIALLMAQAAAPAQAKPAQPARPTKASIEKDAKQVFARIDTNGDGKVERAEADKAYAVIVANETARRAKFEAESFAKLDTNKDGSISRQEFSAAVAPLKAGKEAWFDANDIDRNGRVELNEATARALRNFELVDADKNGTLSDEEMRAARGRLAAK